MSNSCSVVSLRSEGSFGLAPGKDPAKVRCRSRRMFRATCSVRNLIASWPSQTVGAERTFLLISRILQPTEQHFDGIDLNVQEVALSI